MNRGRLLVRVDTGVASKILCGVFFACAGIFAVVYIIDDLDFSANMVLLIFLGMGILLGMALRSHCEVYENAVAGVTQIGTEGGMRKFELSYGEILNVAEGGKQIILYTGYAVFRVAAAGSNRAAAVQEIRRRTGENHAHAAAQTHRPVNQPYSGGTGVCPKCGAPISQPSSFCEKCGNPLR